jgi:hypothetical protein
MSAAVNAKGHFYSGKSTDRANPLNVENYWGYTEELDSGKTVKISGGWGWDGVFY